MATQTLEEFKLYYFELDAMRMVCLLEGLHSNLSVSKLSLLGCSFSDGAGDVFAEYMQEKNRIDHIKSLELDGGNTDYIPLFSQILKGQHGSGLTEIASSDCYAIWNSIEGNAMFQCPQWSTLTLHGFYWVENLPNLNLTIQNLLYLRTLTWDDMLKEIINPVYIHRKESFLDAFRKNGSLYRVEVTWNMITDRWWKDNKEISIWSAHEERLLQAWGQRNRNLPEMLRIVKDDCESVAEGGAESWEQGSELIPTLLALAKRTPRMALHHILSGLLALGEIIGPACFPEFSAQVTVPFMMR
jgi:hypothetical protein